MLSFQAASFKLKLLLVSYLQIAQLRCQLSLSKSFTSIRGLSCLNWTFYGNSLACGHPKIASVPGTSIISIKGQSQISWSLRMTSKLSPSNLHLGPPSLIGQLMCHLSNALSMSIDSDFEHIVLQLESDASAWNQFCQVTDPFSPEHLSWLDSPVQPMILTPGIPSHMRTVGALTFLDIPSFSAMNPLIYVRHIAFILPSCFLTLNHRYHWVNVHISSSLLCVRMFMRASVVLWSMNCVAWKRGRSYSKPTKSWNQHQSLKRRARYGKQNRPQGQDKCRLGEWRLQISGCALAEWPIIAPLQSSLHPHAIYCSWKDFADARA